MLCFKTKRHWSKKNRQKKYKRGKIDTNDINPNTFRLIDEGEDGDTNNR